MGCDASAILFYGFIAELPEMVREAIRSEKYDGEDDEWIADLYVVVIPPYKGYREHEANKDRLLPIKLGYMWNFDNSRLVCIRQSVQEALQCVKPIDPEKVRTQPGWDDQLRDFCDKSGIPWEQPKWYLWPDYG